MMHDQTSPIIIEMAPFRLRDGVSMDALGKAARDLEHHFLANQKGFLGRDLVKLEDGRFADLVRWASKADMDAAMAESQSSETCAAYFAIMDYNPDIDPMLSMARINL